MNTGTTEVLETGWERTHEREGQMLMDSWVQDEELTGTFALLFLQ